MLQITCGVPGRVLIQKYLKSNTWPIDQVCFTTESPEPLSIWLKYSWISSRR